MSEPNHPAAFEAYGDVQHPKVRELKFCLECRGPKEPGLLVCWPCNNTMKRRFAGSYDPVLVACFALIEAGKARVIEHGDEKGRIVVT